MWIEGFDFINKTGTNPLCYLPSNAHVCNKYNN